MNFIQNDNLGQISTWLLAHADRDGADCDACERLAELHSVAVDFPKTGRPATFSWEERRRLVRHTWLQPVGCNSPMLLAGPQGHMSTLGACGQCLPCDRVIMRSGECSRYVPHVVHQLRADQQPAGFICLMPYADAL